MHRRLAQVGVGVFGGGLVAVIIVLAVAMASGVGGLAEGRTGSDLGPAPRFSVPQFGGGSFDLDEHAGRPVFIYFWASWCIPCETEAPIIESLWPEYRERGWTFLGVNVWDRESDAQRFVDRHGLTFPLARDEDGSVYLDYGIQGLPTAFFLSADHDIYARFDGLLAEQALRDLLDEARLSQSAERPGDTP